MDCSSALCQQIGYYDDWELMKFTRDTKSFLALCVCIQLLKVKRSDEAAPRRMIIIQILQGER
jgi:hypothetical protein